MDDCATSGGWPWLQMTLDGTMSVLLVMTASVAVLLGRRFGWLTTRHLLWGVVLTAATWLAAGSWDRGRRSDPGWIGREHAISWCAHQPGPHRGLPAAYVVHEPEGGGSLRLIALVADVAVWSCAAAGVAAGARRLRTGSR